MQSSKPVGSPENTKLAAPSVGLHPLSIVRMLWKQSGFIILAWVVLSIAGIVIVHRLPPVYRAESLVLVESQKIPESLVASTVNAELQDRLATISQQILSGTRLQKIIDKFNLYAGDKKSKTQEEIIERMRADIKIKLERGWTRNQPGAFRISYLGANPEITSAVANDLTGLFVEENMRTREVQATGTSEFIENQLGQAKKSLEEQEKKVSEYKRLHNGELPEQEQSLLSRLEQLRTELQGNQEAVARAQQTKMLLEGSVESAEASRAALMSAGVLTPEAGTTINPATGAVVSNTSNPQPKRSTVLMNELAALRARYTDLHPLVKETQSALVLAQKEEEAEQNRQTQAAAQAAEASKRNAATGTAEVKQPKLSPAAAQLLVREQERVQGLKTQLAVAQKELEARQAERQQTLGMIAEYQARVEKIPMRQQEMASLTRDYEVSQNNYKSLLTRNFTADIASDMEKRQKAERFTTLDAARVPEKPYKPNLPVWDSSAAVLALIIAAAIACVREWKKDVILGDWELPASVPILGKIPSIAVAVPTGDFGPWWSIPVRALRGVFRRGSPSDEILSVRSD